MRASVKRPRLAVERLESREVLDATINVAGGTLFIDGTPLADAFRVTDVEVDGAPGYQVDALIHEGRQSTFNDGQTSGVFRASRVTADLLQGDDLLLLQDLSTRTILSLVPADGGMFGPRRIPRIIPGDLLVNTGAGSDEVRLVDAAIDGKVVVDLGSGSDFAVVGSSSARTSMEVKGRAGEDHYIDLGGNDYNADGPKLSSIIATHRESVDGQLTSVINPSAENPLGTMEAVGTGDATHLGHYNETFIHNFTAPNAQGVGQVLNGRFTSTAADGSTISGSYFGTYTVLPDNQVRFDVTPLYQSGTGRFAGVTGRGDVVALLNAADGTFHFDTIGTWTFP